MVVDGHNRDYSHIPAVVVADNTVVLERNIQALAHNPVTDRYMVRAPASAAAAWVAYRHTLDNPVEQAQLAFQALRALTVLPNKQALVARSKMVVVPTARLACLEPFAAEKALVAEEPFPQPLFASASDKMDTDQDHFEPALTMHPFLLPIGMPNNELTASC